MQTSLVSPYRTKQKRRLRWKRASTQRYPGQLYDVESGLHQNGFRDYEAGGGRYIESDPIGLDGGISTYGYVTSNPLNSIDPQGLQQTQPIYTPQPSPVSPNIIPPGPGFGPAANGPSFAPAAGGFGATCSAVATAVIGLVMPGNIFDGARAGCSDDPGRVRSECKDGGDDECSKLISKINLAKYGIARRFRQLSENVGKIDQTTHWEQLRGRQINLRRLINEALSKGCPPPSDAWYYATRLR